MWKQILGWSVAVGAVLMSTSAGAAQQVGPLVEARTIRVSGVGEARAAPDIATMQFGVQTTGATAREAGDANAAVMDRVIQALLGAGVAEADVQTSGYSIYPEYARQTRPGEESEPPRITGYRATNQVSVRTRDLDGVGRLIDVALEAGANQMHGISFQLEDAAAAEAMALQRAVERARRSAQTMADALGVTLGEVLLASTSTDPVQPLYRAAYDQMAVRMESAGAATPVQPGEHQVHATASLVFAIQ